ncbi:MAG: MarC family protein [Victivallales bacterium]|nr:MarC family protein [Victivallales bacterium]
MTFESVLLNSLYFLAIINPVSKISILSVFSSERKDLREVSLKSTLVAFCMLGVIIFFGDILMKKVFRLELYALQISGGIVLAWVGFNALSKGVFFEVGTHNRFTDLAIVPLACPMIAGPATIAAALTFAIRGEKGALILSIALALLFNMLLMFASAAIGGFLKRFNVLGAIIRITGLFVMTIGTQMVFDGYASWR